jgi:hypothetical protein
MDPSTLLRSTLTRRLMLALLAGAAVAKPAATTVYAAHDGT